MKNRLLSLLLAGGLLIAPVAQAAQPVTITGPNGAQANVSGGGLSVNATASIAAFNPTGQASLSASGTTSNVALGSVGPTAIVTNTGSVTAYINFGASSVTATTSSYPLLAGQSIAYNVGSGTYMAGITATSTAALLVTTGTGLPAIANGSSGSSGGSVNLTQVGGSAIVLGSTTSSGSLPVVIASDQAPVSVKQATASSLNAAVVGNTAAGGVDSGNGVKVSGVYNSSLPTLTSTWRSDLQVDNRGELMAQLSSSGSPVGVIASSTDGVGAGSIALVTSGFNRDYNGTTWDRLYSATAAAGTTGTGVQAAGAMGFDGTDYRRLLTDPAGDLSIIPAASPQGGATPAGVNSANSTNATVLKASAGTLYHSGLQNNSTTSLAYAIFFNTATTPTCTATPAYGPVLIPYVGSTGNNGSGVIEDFAVGMSFTTGISYCLTTAPGGTGSVAASQVTGGLSYK